MTGGPGSNIRMRRKRHIGIVLGRFLYSKWFFGLLAILCTVDLVADVGEHIWGWTALNVLAITMDAAAALLSIWIFGDLHRRRPKHGGRAHS
jgi:hypothetical protein